MNISSGTFEETADWLYNIPWLSVSILTGIIFALSYILSHIVTRKLRDTLSEQGIDDKEIKSLIYAFSMLISLGIFSGIHNYIITESNEAAYFTEIKFFLCLNLYWLLLLFWSIGYKFLLDKHNRILYKSNNGAYLFYNIGRHLIILWGGCSIAMILGINVWSVLMALTAFSAVIVYAGKDTIENFMGTLTILFDPPYLIGDRIEFNNTIGKVIEINLRTTKIETDDKINVIIPNANIIRSPVKNWTMAQRNNHQHKKQSLPNK